ncbi:MAG: alanine racemase [Ruminococcaceae bacterium]|nr:alanine racemase [Oscillospiraceae bacterium]
MTHFPICRATAEIDTDALIHNFRTLRMLAEAHAHIADPPPRVIAVVKANAYGHGLSLVVPALLSAGCDFFAVATTDEALSVRLLAPDADILILGYTPPTDVPLLIGHRLLQCVFSLDYAKALNAEAAEQAACLSVHLKIDGGMCRLGFRPDELSALTALSSLSHLRPVGIFTHFPSADTEKDATRDAITRFLTCRSTLYRYGLPPLFTHAAASAALLAMPEETVLCGVRPGIALYGISPVSTSLPLRPVLRLSAPLVDLHEAEAGTPIGYGGSFTTARRSRIGICAIGYGDGLPRRLRGYRVTLLHGNQRFFAPIVGHICMDYTLLDLTNTPAEVGDTVLLFDDPTPISAACGTIPYEILTGISARVKRTRKGESL